MVAKYPKLGDFYLDYSNFKTKIDITQQFTLSPLKPRGGRGGTNAHMPTNCVYFKSTIKIFAHIY